MVEIERRFAAIQRFRWYFLGFFVAWLVYSVLAFFIALNMPDSKTSYETTVKFNGQKTIIVSDHELKEYELARAKIALNPKINDTVFYVKHSQGEEYTTIYVRGENIGQIKGVHEPGSSEFDNFLKIHSDELGKGWRVKNEVARVEVQNRDSQVIWSKNGPASKEEIETGISQNINRHNASLPADDDFDKWYRDDMYVYTYFRANIINLDTNEVVYSAEFEDGDRSRPFEQMQTEDDLSEVIASLLEEGKIHDKFRYIQTTGDVSSTLYGPNNEPIGDPRPGRLSRDDFRERIEAEKIKMLADDDYNIESEIISGEFPGHGYIVSVLEFPLALLLIFSLVSTMLIGKEESEASKKADINQLEDGQMSKMVFFRNTMSGLSSTGMLIVIQIGLGAFYFLPRWTENFWAEAKFVVYGLIIFIALVWAAQLFLRMHYNAQANAYAMNNEEIRLQLEMKKIEAQALLPEHTTANETDPSMEELNGPGSQGGGTIDAEYEEQ